MSEIVYVLTNPAMPGYTKIGKTSNGLKSRMHQLDSTGVPLPFECFYAAVVKDSSFVEKQLHEAFLDQRVRSNREFFEISPERVRAALKLVEIEDATPDDTSQTAEDQVALDKARTRRTNFNFTMVGIPSGSTLEYVRDSSVTAKVIDDKNMLDYFLVVWELVRFCEKNQISTGAGRGSSAGSLLSWWRL